jgi:hypothetical protein
VKPRRTEKNARFVSKGSFLLAEFLDFGQQAFSLQRRFMLT